ncbi:MAG: SagB/ThcOx family dehydrogenase [Desulfobacterales bacterium]|nr:SagB/ThcOx family dehydrogenase [Desulfobacterales bacterium]
MNKIELFRNFLKDSIRKTIDFRTTDQNMGIPVPPIEKPFDPNALRIKLPQPDQWMPKINKTDLVSAMSNRRSRRRFTSAGLSAEDLAFLLWATQGIRKLTNTHSAYRIVPSAGARHSFETYLFVIRVDGIEKGLYRYLPVENELLFIGEVKDMRERLSRACLGQSFVAEGAATFVWAAIPYRMEWRYSLAAHRVILIDAGHVCQNLYLACEAIHAGACAVGAYDQEQLDELLQVDGTDEFAVYLAPVGKI